MQLFSTHHKNMTLLSKRSRQLLCHQCNCCPLRLQILPVKNMILWVISPKERLLKKIIFDILKQERIKGLTELIPHIGPIPIVIPVKIFLDLSEICSLD